MVEIFGRTLNILLSNSFFLFGARGTGKSTLIKQKLPATSLLPIDLLFPSQERRFRERPEELAEVIKAAKTLNPNLEWVLIDEVQKVPELLDVVHSLIESTDLNIKFALTGSSARKLKRGGANLLAGRAFVYNLFPLTHEELGETFNLDFALRWGTLPKIFSFSQDLEREMFLEAYVKTYLAEEILEEQLIRKVAPFKKFLSISGQTSGQLVNFAKIGSDIGVDSKTAMSYFNILEDTLVGFFLPPYERSLRRQQLLSPKFYLFDTGIMRCLAGVINNSAISSQELGRLFEQFIICEIYRLNSYHRSRYSLYHWATPSGSEVDLVLEHPQKEPVLIEIKYSTDITSDHLKHLVALHKDYPKMRKLCICRESYPRVHNGIEILPWTTALRELGLTS